MNRLYGIILRLLLPVLAAVCPFVPEARAQRPSFADGYHGGKAGHADGYGYYYERIGHSFSFKTRGAGDHTSLSTLFAVIISLFLSFS